MKKLTAGYGRRWDIPLEMDVHLLTSNKGLLSIWDKGTFIEETNGTIWIEWSRENKK